jgi:hypothetical protein
LDTLYLKYKTLPPREFAAKLFRHAVLVAKRKVLGSKL